VRILLQGSSSATILKGYYEEKERRFDTNSEQAQGYKNVHGANKRRRLHWGSRNMVNKLITAQCGTLENKE
tara:strand:- start:314 stop:526 length:213 start_codon:yes stop_codon:yes gene_type:complete